MPSTEEKNSQTAPENSAEQQAAAQAAATATGTENTPAGDENEEDDTDGGDAAKTPIKLTSKQLNDRLERATKAERKKVLADLGFDSEDAAKAAMTSAKEAERAKLSEVERLKLERDEATKRANDAQNILNEQARLREEADSRSGLEKILKKAGVTDDALELAMLRATKFITANFEDDDKVTAKKLEPFVTGLQTEKVLWFEAVEVPAGASAKNVNTTTSTKPTSNTVPQPEFDHDEMMRDPVKWAAYKARMGTGTY